MFSRFVDLNFSAAGIVVADPNGRHLRELTHPVANTLEHFAQLSPDGRRIVFLREPPEGDPRIVVMGSDGRGERVLDLGCVAPCAVDIQPTWTPDGQHIVFERLTEPFDENTGTFFGGSLWQSDLAGHHLKRLSEAGIEPDFHEGTATFAPGGYLVFVRLRMADHQSAVFRMNPDATHVHQLTPWAFVGKAEVSPATSGPTRDLILFDTGPTSGPTAVATVPATCRSDADCASRIRVLTSPTPLVQEFQPTWSPDGRRIAFFRFEQAAVPTGPFDLKGDIWTMRWDGQDRKAAVDSPLFEYEPSWGPAARRSTRHALAAVTIELGG